MSERRIFFKKNHPVHIISRAIKERNIFENKEDCYRFIFQIYAANRGKPAFKLWQKDLIKAAQYLLDGQGLSSKFIIKEHDPLVNILDFSLVINHYHFYLVPNIENGVPLFMMKLNVGFAKYFNSKYDRKGSLFESRYKSVPVKTEFQSDAVSRYVSVINPLDIYQPGWREKGLADLEEAFGFLEDYQFSSFPDKIRIRRSKIIAPQELLERFCSINTLTKEEYFEFVQNFLKQRMSSSNPLLLE